ncbi:MAG: GIY-YIG nuclease family protein [Nitrospinota bacterium]|nr:GIY-YIG nuclease family protein [Nitrospinota bacterium]MDH5755458.1 GIY-YIG nuclease family protein [Nitrospinota bacterium]
MNDDVEINWLVYLLQCGDGSYYCGATNDLSRRIDQHNRGTASRYTRGRGPVTLVAQSREMQKGAALSLEAKVKKARKDMKAQMVEQC